MSWTEWRDGLVYWWELVKGGTSKREQELKKELELLVERKDKEININEIREMYDNLEVTVDICTDKKLYIRTVSEEFNSYVFVEYNGEHHIVFEKGGILWSMSPEAWDVEQAYQKCLSVLYGCPCKIYNDGFWADREDEIRWVKKCLQNWDEAKKEFIKCAKIYRKDENV